jgi:hypothetical protein
MQNLRRFFRKYLLFHALFAFFFARAFVVRSEEE